MSTEVTRYDDVIDSRDLVEFIESNEGEMTDAELKPYRDFAKEFEDCAPDFHHGETAIHELHFTEYCIDLVSDLGYLPDDLPGFIESNINWHGVADDLKVDYSLIYFDGEGYYVR